MLESTARESFYMKIVRFLLFFLFLTPFAAFAAPDGNFVAAAQLLSAARTGNTQQIQMLINGGADINYVDATGLSVVCTAVMNNDMRAVQILQMYGADASNCDRQIKKYQNRTNPTVETGLFSGLSSTHNMVLVGAGAAAIVGGLLLLTDVFDSDNNNVTPGGGGNRGDGNSGETTPDGNPSLGGTGLPYGPMMTDANAENINYDANRDVYSTTGRPIILADYELMTDVYGLNYLLMMRGYSPFARGYMGQRTLRYADRSPVPASVLGGYSLTTDSTVSPGGGAPVNVVLVTANGINTAFKPAGDYSAGVSSLDDKLLLWTGISNNIVNNPSITTISDKYYNSEVTLGAADDGYMTGATTTEDDALVTKFDLSGYGTAINNASATQQDNLLAKIVGGDIGGYVNADFIGFMPNGQMTIYRTGNGVAFTSAGTGSTPLFSGYTLDGDGDLLTLGDGTNTYDVTILNNDNNTFSATNTAYIAESGLTAFVPGTTYYTYDDGTDAYNTVDTSIVTEPEAGVTYYTAVTSTYYGYISANGNFYVNSTPGGTLNDVDQAYLMTDGTLMLYGARNTNVDYYNYTALLDALVSLWKNGAVNSVRSRPSVIANVAVIEPLHATTTATINDVMNAYTPNNGAAMVNAFVGFVNENYDSDYSVSNTDIDQGDYANQFFTRLAADASAVSNEDMSPPMVIFSTGASVTNSGFTNDPLVATFENAAPLVYSGLGHHFMSVVAVSSDTSGTGTVSGYSPNGFGLSTWHIPTGYTAVNTATDVFNGATTYYTRSLVEGNYKYTPQVGLTEFADGTDYYTVADNTYYQSRVCGLAGKGGGGVDPWCFAAAGDTDATAVSAAAGAVGAIKGAFSYLTTDQIFTLLALTADGPFLGTSTGGAPYTNETLTTYLSEIYTLPGMYQYRVIGGEDYLTVFKEVFGYGMINLERATKPMTNVFFYDGNKIVSMPENAYWRAATGTMVRGVSALGLRGATVHTAAYDVLQSVDGSLQLPRVWNNEFTFNTNDRHGLYMGDVLGDLKTRDAEPVRNTVGNIGFSMSVSERAYNDNMNGLDNMQIDYVLGNLQMSGGYQHYLTDGASRFSGVANPIRALASNAITSDAMYSLGAWSFGGRAFSGEITDEGLLENDPTVTAQFNPARLGGIFGAESNLAWHGDMFDFGTVLGVARETDTLLGARFDGLMELSGGDTTYIDATMRFRPYDGVTLALRGTFARTDANAVGAIVADVSDLYSDAFSAQLNIGNFSFVVANPLAVVNGGLRYAYAEYNVVGDDGHYDLVVRDAHTQEIDLSADRRELRFSGSYKHNFGEFTDGAIGFMYRMNPNNTDAFGNESIFMLKLTHRLGI